MFPTKKYLALGDSYTIGESVPVAGRWPLQLVEKFKNDSVYFSEVKIVAKTGWTTDELISQLTKEKITHDYELVSLLIGVNNQYRNYSLNVYEKEFEILLKKAIQYADGRRERVFVLSIPDWGKTPFAEGKNLTKIEQEINAFNAVNLKISKLYNVRYFDITDISRKAPEHQNLIAEDGLHPSAQMYSEWVELLYPAVKEMLK